MVVTELLRAGKSVRYFTNNSAARPIQVSAFLNERVLLVGEEAFAQTLRDKGIEPTNERPDAVVVGICRTISYELLDRAAAAIRDGLPFLATNRDATYPLESGRLQPGAGAIVAAIEVASGMEPEVLGKPNPRRRR
jgi:4-nitrophenyl phosphatase